MTKNPRRSLAAAAALAAVTLAGCSLATGATPAAPTPASPVAASSAPATPVTVTATPAATVTVAAPPPPVTVTVTPPPAPAPAAAHYTGTGAFQSPSGNINCALFSFGGDDSVQCELAQHDWVAPPKEPECHLDWGSRFLLNQSAGALFACYGQELPAPERTLGYGSTWSVGSITCDSEAAGMTCTDGSNGHYFFISRETWRLG
jgi:hypothetical protein